VKPLEAAIAALLPSTTTLSVWTWNEGNGTLRHGIMHWARFRPSGGHDIGAEPFTKLQGQYLAFIVAYTKVHGVPPAEADLQRYFKVTPPTVHQMVLTLERRGLITRAAGQARSIGVVLPPERLPPLE
jgi:hypothetical protein